MPLSPKSLRAFKRDSEDPRHGTQAGYSYGCRCERCSHAEKLRRVERERMKASSAEKESLPLDFPGFLDRFESAQPDEIGSLAKEFKAAFLKSSLPVSYYRDVLNEIEEANTFEHDVTCESAECVLSLITHAVVMDDAYEGYLSASFESGYLTTWLERLCKIYCD